MAGKNKKCKGGKVRKMADGGYALNDLTEMMDELELAEKNQGRSNIFQEIINGGLAGTTIAPGLGSFFGAVGGLGKGLVENLLNKKANQAKKDKLKTSINQSAADVVEGTKSRFGYQKGGKIKGKGTGTSDSIEMDIPAGSFIVPTENSEVAMEIGEKLLGWKKDQEILKRKSGEEVYVSNGEVMFSPTEAKALTSIGIDLNELAPKADSDKKMKNGTPPWFAEEVGPVNKTSVINPSRNYFDDSIYKIALENELGNLSPEEKKAAKETLTTVSLSNNDISDFITNADQENPKSESKFDINDIAKWAGTALGAGQIMGGVSKLASTPDPDMLTVSDDLDKLVAETNAEAQYGLEPAEKAAAERKIQRNVNQALEKVESEFAGGPGTTYNLVADILNKGNMAALELPVIDEQMKREKRNIARNMKLQRSQRKDYIEEFAFKDARQNQGLLSDIVSAGVENLVGSLQFHQYLEAKKERDKLNSSLI